ncbi:MAG: GNAT family N-acetyltransferase [Candidatus Aminicenantes bacterium]|nr:MAG: GNAT family N-acetyltransferase [Candidatus Aminicenantes bacterium]
MEIEFFPKLTSALAERVNQFRLENFYTEEERTPENLAAEEESFCSQPKAWLLVFEGDQIIGTILLHERKVMFNNGEVNLGGIGSVCTHTDKRNQGIATSMLKEAVKILLKWECDIAYLCANIEETGYLYGQVGFVPLNKPYTYYGRSGKLHQGNNGMIAPLNSSSIFEEVLSSKHKLHLGQGNW